VIYLSIPILIIPQLLFSGVIVKFDKLHPWFAIQDEVPFIGNVMASRWSYEALAVTQFKHNELESHFFELNQIKSNVGWKRDYWIPAMKTKIEFLRQASKKPQKEVNEAYEILFNEIKREEQQWDNLKCNNCLVGIEQKIIENSVALESELLNFINVLNSHFNNTFNKVTAEIDSEIKKFGDDKYENLKGLVTNEALTDYATNRIEIDKLVEEKQRLVQKEDPIYLEPKGKRFLDAHFYAPNKYFLGKKIDTFWANIGVLWVMSFFLMITLYYDSLSKTLAWFGKFTENRSQKKALKQNK
jgi:ABC transport system ATP-binding/permease protein